MELAFAIASVLVLVGLLVTGFAFAVDTWLEQRSNDYRLTWEDEQ